MARALQGGCRGVLSLYFHCPAPTEIWGLAHDAHTGWFGGLERQWRHPLWRRSTRGSRGCYSCAGCRQLCGVVPRSAVIAGTWLVFDPRPRHIAQKSETGRPRRRLATPDPKGLVLGPTFGEERVSAIHFGLGAMQKALEPPPGGHCTAFCFRALLSRTTSGVLSCAPRTRRHAGCGCYS